MKKKSDAKELRKGRMNCSKQHLNRPKVEMALKYAFPHNPRAVRGDPPAGSS
jgi:hypothetical protein